MDCNKLQISKSTMSTALTNASPSTSSAIVERAVEPVVGGTADNTIPMDVDESDGEIERVERQAEIEAQKAADAAAKARQAVEEAKAARERRREERRRELAERARLEAEKARLEAEEARVEAERQAWVEAEERARVEAARAAEMAPIVAVSGVTDFLEFIGLILHR